MRANAGPAPGLELGGGWQLGIDGQYRPRFLLDVGHSAASPGTAEYLTQRARLGLTVGRAGGPSFTLRLQDVRTWGEEHNTLNDFSADGLDAHEAYARLPLGQRFALTLGRQELVFDDARLVGNVGWTQRARSFDAARLHRAGDHFAADLVLAIVSEGDPNPDGHVPAGRQGDVLFGAFHADFALGKDAHLAAAWYVVSTDATRTVRHTFGGYAHGQAHGLTYAGSLYYQVGNAGSTPISAFLASLRLGHTLALPARPGLEVWADALSGDGTPAGTFDTLYATNHKFYGELDRFLVIPRDTGNLGLLDLGVRLRGRLTGPVSAHLDGHAFRSLRASPSGARDLGFEVDAKVIVKIRAGLSVRALYGVFVAGPAFVAVHGAGPRVAHLAYLTLDLKV